MDKTSYWPGLKVVIVNGRPGSGKTLFERYCQELLGTSMCKIRSSIDRIKEIAIQSGWNGQKDERGRWFLSELKRITTEYNDLPLMDIVEFIVNWFNTLTSDSDRQMLRILFVDIREPEEIKKFVDFFDATTVFVMRPDAKPIDSNASDSNVMNYTYDYVINNDKTQEDLKLEALKFINLLREEVDHERNC